MPLRMLKCRATNSKLVIIVLACCIAINLMYIMSGWTPQMPCQCDQMRLNVSPATKARTQVGSSTTGSPSGGLSTTKKEIDMVNDYVPFVDFKFVFPHVMPRLQDIQDLYLVVFVNSAAKGDEYRERRDTIRKTWASHATCEQRTADQEIRNLQWRLVFVVGLAGTESEDKRNLEESKEHNDMLIGDIDDNYINNVLKLYMAFIWATTFTPKYILKTDDDVYVSVPRVLQYLRDVKFPNRFYGGETYSVSGVMRWPGGKWSVSRKYYPEDNWPEFNAGAFYVISSDLVPSLCGYTKQRLPFHTDDAYIGVAMRDLKVKVRQIPSFDIHNKMNQLVRTKSNCEILDLVAYAHNVDPASSNVLHGRLEGMCAKNITKNNCK